MAYPQRASGGAHGFFNGSCASSAPLQEFWLNKSPGLGQAFDLGFGILNSHDSFDQQNQNFDVALHAIENTSQFAAVFPSSQDHLSASGSAPSIPLVPEYYSGVIDSQIYHPNTYMQADHGFGSGEALVLPVELLDRSHGVPNIQARTRQVVTELGLIRFLGTRSNGSN
jgi:hypothetical protein